MTAIIQPATSHPTMSFRCYCERCGFAGRWTSEASAITQTVAHNRVEHPSLADLLIAASAATQRAFMTAKECGRDDLAEELHKAGGAIFAALVRQVKS